jgi:hypothetical protein
MFSKQFKIWNVITEIVGVNFNMSMCIAILQIVFKVVHYFWHMPQIQGRYSYFIKNLFFSMQAVNHCFVQHKATDYALNNQMVHSLGEGSHSLYQNQQNRNMMFDIRYCEA